MIRSADDAAANNAAATAIAEAIALLEAIDFGELLSAHPADPAERTRHAVGATLLLLVEQRLKAARTHLRRAAQGDRAACPLTAPVAATAAQAA